MGYNCVSTIDKYYGANLCNPTNLQKPIDFYAFLFYDIGRTEVYIKL